MRKAASQRLGNIIPVLANGCLTSIPANRADMVLALEMFFGVKDPTALLNGVRRV